jgi:hypothetical protein
LIVFGAVTWLHFLFLFILISLEEIKSSPFLPNPCVQPSGLNWQSEVKGRDNKNVSVASKKALYQQKASPESISPQFSNQILFQQNLAAQMDEKKKGLGQ